jgi:ferric-dicitrate binding protein FerR (iron transport regulator)
MECSEALDLLYESFDGQITPAQAALLNGHRRTCFACAGTLAKAQRFQELLHRVPQLTVPRGLEARIIQRVLHTAPGTAARSRPRPRRIPPWTALARPLLAGAGSLAAAAVAFFIYQAVVVNAVHRPPDQTVVATIQGAVQDVMPNHRVREVAGTDTPLSTGEVLRPVGSSPAIVSITPHLALIMNGGSEVHISRLHYDAQTGLADVIFLQLLRGTLRVHEILHRDVSPVRVATAQATFVPTGTVFAVTALRHATNLAVHAGTVAVYMPGRVFSVIAGHGVHITDDGTVHDVIIGRPPRPAHRPSGATRRQAPAG